MSCSIRAARSREKKYSMLRLYCSRLDLQDLDKFDMARKLHGEIDKIRGRYTDDFKSKEMQVRQRAVALYFIDKVCFLSFIRYLMNTVVGVACRQ